MSENAFVMEVTVGTFDAVVIEASRSTPVLVDFWAGWCQPCQMLMPILDKLAKEYQGKFRVAKVDTDAEQELALRFGVRSLPTVKLFVDGELVDGFMGVQPESAIRRILDQWVPRESDEARTEASRLIAAGDSPRAISVLEATSAADPDNPRVKPDLLRALIDAEAFDRAARLLADLPMNERLEAPYTDLGVELRVRQRASGAGEVDADTLKLAIERDPADLEKRLELAAKLTVAGEHREALEQYLEVTKRNRGFQEDAGRKGLVELFQLLGDANPLVTEYRRRMAALLY